VFDQQRDDDGTEQKRERFLTSVLGTGRSTGRCWALFGHRVPLELAREFRQHRAAEAEVGPLSDLLAYLGCAGIRASELP
jgi:hypothetical protein